MSGESLGSPCAWRRELLSKYCRLPKKDSTRYESKEGFYFMGINEHCDMLQLRYSLNVFSFVVQAVTAAIALMLIPLLVRHKRKTMLSMRIVNWDTKPLRTDTNHASNLADEGPFRFQIGPKLHQAPLRYEPHLTCRPGISHSHIL